MNPLRRRRLLGIGSGGAAGLLAASLAGCAGLFGPPTVTLSPSELERLVARRFPLERRVLEVVDLTLAAPRLRLEPERNRIGATLALAARERLLAGQWTGRLDFDAALRWEPGERSVRLAEVRVHELVLDGQAGTTRRAIERAGAALVEKLLEGERVYVLPADRAERLRRAGYAPSGVAVTARGVEIGFEHVAR